MNEKWTFRFRTKPRIEGEPMTFKDAEEYLLARLDDPDGNPQEARLQLVCFYGNFGRVSQALRYADEFLAECTDSEERAEMFFRLGQLMEYLADWRAAILYYSEALEMGARDEILRYFCHNNIGYSLNQLGCYVEAETYLRGAIGIDESRANAFKNLGLSLQGQGKVADAARSFIAAVRADASDPRALGHLRELAGNHRELYELIPDLDYQISKCCEAVEYAARNQFAAPFPVDPQSKLAN